MYSVEELDKQKTRVFKFLTYKKRTENEIRNKFKKDIDDNMLEDIIEYFKDAGYIDDYKYVEKQVKEYMTLKNMSIKEIEYKLFQKGVDRKIIEEYIQNNINELEEYEKKSKENIINKKKNLIDEDKLEQYLYQKGYGKD